MQDGVMRGSHEVRKKRDEVPSNAPLLWVAKGEVPLWVPFWWTKCDRGNWRTLNFGGKTEHCALYNVLPVAKIGFTYTIRAVIYVSHFPTPSLSNVSPISVMSTPVHNATNNATNFWAMCHSLICHFHLHTVLKWTAFEHNVRLI